MSTYDCKPTLTDSQVLEFCKSGHLMLEGVVPDEINRKTVAWLDEMHASGLGRSEAVKLLDEDWFSTFVMHNAQASGALRSLLSSPTRPLSDRPPTHPGFGHTINPQIGWPVILTS